jgi:hypothetical protein
MSVDAPREKLKIATEDMVMSAASRCPPGLNLRMCRKIRKMRAKAPEEEGSLADQSETPNSLKKPIARQ